MQYEANYSKVEYINRGKLCLPFANFDIISRGMRAEASDRQTAAPAPDPNPSELVAVALLQ